MQLTDGTRSLGKRACRAMHGTARVSHQSVIQLHEPDARLAAVQMAGEAEGLLERPGAPCAALAALPLLPPLLGAPALRAAVISAPLLAGVAALLGAAAAAADAMPDDAMASPAACWLAAPSLPASRGFGVVTRLPATWRCWREAGCVLHGGRAVDGHAASRLPPVPAVLGSGLQARRRAWWRWWRR